MKKTALLVSLLLLSTQAFPQETISAATALPEALLAKGSTDEALASYLKALSLDASFGA
jgi:hypothetical protein